MTVFMYWAHIMNNDTVKELINKSVYSSYLFECCELLSLMSNNLIECTQSCKSGLSSSEEECIIRDCFDLISIRDNLLQYISKFRNEVSSHFD